MIVLIFRFDTPYDPPQVANYDEVPLFFDLTPDHTLDFKGVPGVNVRPTPKYKMRVTVALCCLANGYRFPPFLVFKESSGKLPQKIERAYDSERIVIKGNSKGWMNGGLMKDWVEEVWAPNIETDKNYLLIWDSFSCHKDNDLINCLAEIMILRSPSSLEVALQCHSP